MVITLLNTSVRPNFINEINKHCPTCTSALKNPITISNYSHNQVSFDIERLHHQPPRGNHKSDNS
jgi:hypothetical protein